MTGHLQISMSILGSKRNQNFLSDRQRIRKRYWGITIEQRYMMHTIFGL